MNMKHIKFLFAGATVALSCTGLADPSSEQIGKYTWYYQIVDGKSAQICRAGDAMGAVNPKPEGPLTIPTKLGGKPVTSIGDSAFSLYDTITSVTIHDTVTDIGENAFYQNGKLQCVQFGKKVNKIGSAAFYDCKELKSIVFKGNAPTDVDDIAFDGVRGDCCVYRAKAARGWEKAQDNFVWIFGLDYKIGDCVVDIPAEPYSIRGGTGTVTGGGQYVVGKKVALKAKADAGSVFCGWMSQDLLSGKTAHLSYALSYSDYVVSGESIKFVGRFITAQEDMEYFALKPCDVGTDSDGALDLDLTTYVSTWSEPKLTFKNLPAGLKYDAKAFKITGKATKPGIYKVTVSATNVSVKKAITAEWTITVPNFYDDAVPVADYFGDFIPGVAYSDMIAEAEGCTVTGLPTGMKWTSKSITDKTLGLVQADSYYGAPTKPGYYTVYFTKTVKEGTKNVKHTTTATFCVGPFPKLTIKTEGNSGKDKVTGAGEYAANKKVTLKATPDNSKDNTKVFSGWYDSDGELISQSPSYSYIMPELDTEITAKFITPGEDAKGVSVTVDGIAPFNDSYVTEANLECGVYMAWPIEMTSASLSTVKVTGLPAGLKFTAKDIYDTKQKDLRIISANTIYGTPTTASKKIGLGDLIPSTVQIAVTTGGKFTRYYTIKTYVNAMRDWAVGSFYGGHESGAMQASFTVTSAGKISGKENSMDGQALTDTAPYFTKYDSNKYEATIEQKGKGYLDASVIELTQLDGNLGEIWIGSNGIRLYRAPWKDEPCKTLAKKFTTAAAKTLTIDGIKDDESNPGSLTLTFDNAGAVKVKGVFETPTGKYTATGSSMVTPITYIGNADDTFDAYVFVTLPWKTGKFGGYGARFTLFWDGTAFSLK